MKISVIIPVYNVASWIEACLRSVFDQAERGGVEVQCIVVDDCGTDGSMAIVERLAPEAEKCGVDFHIVSHIRNRGQSAARNTGTAVATGDYIFYLDGDDALEPQALAEMGAAALAAEYPDWVQGNYRRVLPTGTVKEVTSYFDPECPVYADQAEVVAHFDRLNFTNATNKLIRTDFIRENGLTFCEGLIYEDALWCMQAYSVVERIATLEAITYRHNLREGSIMRSGMTEAKMDSLLYIIQRMTELPQDSNMEHRAVFNAVYGMKNLYLYPFSGRYRAQWMKRLWATGVRHGEREGAGLQPLSKWIARAFRYRLGLAKVYLRGLLGAYRIFLRLRWAA